MARRLRISPRRSLLAVLVAGGALCAVGDTAGAQTDKPKGLAFVDERPLKLQLAKAKKGVERQVCNFGRDAADAIRASLTGFDFEDVEKEPRVDDDVWKSSTLASVTEGGGESAGQGATESADQSTSASTLAPGACLTVGIEARAVRLATGDYAGVLMLMSDGAGAARLGVTLTVPTVPGTKTQVAKGLSDPVALTAIRPWPGGSANLQGGELPIEVERGKEPPEVPPAGTFVGTVVKGASVGEVFVDGDAVPKGAAKDGTGGYLAVPLKVTGIDKAGTFKGSLDLRPVGGDKAQPVKISVAVGDGIWWALAVIGLGIGATLLGQLYLRRWRIKCKLYERLDALEDDYELAESRFHALFPELRRDPKPELRMTATAERPPVGIKRPSPEQIRKHVDDVKEAIEVDMRSSWFFDPTSDAYKGILESIELVEDDAKYLGSWTGFGKHLVALRDATEAIVPEAGIGLPALVAEATAIYGPGTLKVGEATARGAKADEYVGLIAQFTALEAKVARLRRWVVALRQHQHAEWVAREAGAATDAARPWTVRDRWWLEDAAGKVEEAHYELHDVTDPMLLAAYGVERDLDIAYATLARLGGRYRTWPEDAVEHADDRAWAAFGANRWAEFGADINALRTMDQGATKAMRFVGGLVTRAIQAAQLRKTLGAVADWAILIISVVLAVGAALVASDFGETWGSTTDYLTLLLASATVNGAVTGLGDIATKLTVGTRTARAAKPAAAAEAEPTATVTPAG